MAGKVCDSYCLKCIYYIGSCELARFCNYYLMTDKRRPCNAGKGCTVKIERIRKKRPRKDA